MKTEQEKQRDAEMLVRGLRNGVYDQKISDIGWENTKESWMKDLNWLLAQKIKNPGYRVIDI